MRWANKCSWDWEIHVNVRITALFQGMSTLIGYRSAAIDFAEGHLPELSLDGFAYVYFQWDQRAKQQTLQVFASILHKLFPISADVRSGVEELRTKKLTSSTKPTGDELAKILTGLTPSSSTTQSNGRLLVVLTPWMKPP